MNKTTSDGNTEIPEVEDIIIEDGDDADTIKTKVADYKSKVDERNKQLYARVKKSEGFELVDGKWVKPQAPIEKKPNDTDPSEKSLSQKDLITLITAKVPEEDMEEVIEYAQFRKITVKDALESPVIKNILSTKAEQRKVAEGTATGAGKTRGSSKLSDEALLSNAEKGTLPESDEDMKRLASLQLKKSRK